MDITALTSLTAGNSIVITAEAVSGYTTAKLTFKALSGASYSISGVLDNGVFSFAVTGLISQTWQSGIYQYQIAQSSLTDRTISNSGTVEVLPNLEVQTPDEKMLQAIETVLQTQTGEARGSISIDGSSITYKNTKELMQIRAELELRIRKANSGITRYIKLNIIG